MIEKQKYYLVNFSIKYMKKPDYNLILIEILDLIFKQTKSEQF